MIKLVIIKIDGISNISSNESIIQDIQIYKAYDYNNRGILSLQLIQENYIP